MKKLKLTAGLFCLILISSLLAFFASVLICFILVLVVSCWTVCAGQDCFMLCILTSITLLAIISCACSCACIMVLPWRASQTRRTLGGKIHAWPTACAAIGGSSSLILVLAPGTVLTVSGSPPGGLAHNILPQSTCFADGSSS